MIHHVTIFFRFWYGLLLEAASCSGFCSIIIASLAKDVVLLFHPDSWKLDNIYNRGSPMTTSTPLEVLSKFSEVKGILLAQTCTQ